MSSFTGGAFAEPRWRSTVILLAAFTALSSGALSRGMVAQPRRLKAANALTGVKYLSHRPIRALLRRTRIEHMSSAYHALFSATATATDAHAKPRVGGCGRPGASREAALFRLRSPPNDAWPTPYKSTGSRMARFEP